MGTNPAAAVGTIQRISPTRKVQLAEVLDLQEGGGEPIDGSHEFLHEKLGIDPNEVSEKELPDFLR